jgi:hypothetical protein
MVLALLLCLVFALVWTVALVGLPGDLHEMPSDRRSRDSRRGGRP